MGYSLTFIALIRPSTWGSIYEVRLKVIRQVNYQEWGSLQKSHCWWTRPWCRACPPSCPTTVRELPSGRWRRWCPCASWPCRWSRTLRSLRLANWKKSLMSTCAQCYKNLSRGKLRKLNIPPPPPHTQKKKSLKTDRKLVKCQKLPFNGKIL